MQGRVLQQIFASMRETAWLRNGSSVCSSMWAFPSHTAVFQKQSLLPGSYRGLCCFCKSILHRKLYPRNIKGKCFQNTKVSPLAKKGCWNEIVNSVYWAKSTSDVKKKKKIPWLWNWDLQRNPNHSWFLWSSFIEDKSQKCLTSWLEWSFTSVTIDASFPCGQNSPKHYLHMSDVRWILKFIFSIVSSYVCIGQHSWNQPIMDEIYPKLRERCVSTEHVQTAFLSC